MPFKCFGLIFLLDNFCELFAVFNQFVIEFIRDMKLKVDKEVKGKKIVRNSGKIGMSRVMG